MPSSGKDCTGSPHRSRRNQSAPRARAAGNSARAFHQRHSWPRMAEAYRNAGGTWKATGPTGTITLALDEVDRDPNHGTRMALRLWKTVGFRMMTAAGLLSPPFVVLSLLCSRPITSPSMGPPMTNNIH